MLTLFFRAALLLALVTGCTHAAAPDGMPADQWQSVALGGSRVGHRLVTRSVQGERVTTRETLVVTLQQPGAPVRSSETVIEYVETTDGKPLALRKRVDSASASHRMNAAVKGGRLVVYLGRIGATESYAIPRPFYLREGVRRVLLRQSSDRRKLEYYTWNFTRLAFEKILLTATAHADPGNPGYRWKILREKPGDAAAPVTTLYADEDFYPLAEYTTLSGDAFAITSCDKACALADFAPTTHVYRHLIRSPYKITDAALNGVIRYRLRGDFDLAVPETFEQRVTRTGEGVEVVVCADCGGESPPDKNALAAALAPSYWLPAEHPEIRRAVAQVLPDGRVSPRSRMVRLTRFVSRHMHEEADYAGYATALEAYRKRTGDCTEHALLLAALGRAAGVPTRVALGLAYNNDRFLGRRYVFVPHAWVQAWVGDRWESFDSGLGQFSAGYITLGLSQGEQDAIIRVNGQLHRIDIVSAVQLAKRDAP